MINLAENTPDGFHWELCTEDGWTNCFKTFEPFSQYRLVPNRQETWKKHPEIDVEISDFGGVRRASDGLLLKVHLDASGYRKFTRRGQGFQLIKSLYEAHIGPTGGHRVTLIDGDKSNVVATNLKLATPKHIYKNRNRWFCKLDGTYHPTEASAKTHLRGLV